MATVKKSYGLFEAVGIELEYMIVNQQSIAVSPIADKLLFETSGNNDGDVENGPIAWSNELSLHVVELKTNGPAHSTEGLSALFHQNILDINKRLEKHQAMLLPTAVHPLMNPLKETQLWPHSYQEVYGLYNQIFDCSGHGWSNLQSMHINLPFSGDQEFGKLHAAIRLVLPLIPALAASSPILDGQFTGYLDGRMETYLHNQEKLRSIMGSLIPEKVFSQQAYQEVIYQSIQDEIKPYDKQGVLERHFLNSRGAIARFDRGAVEIRVTDLQESPLMDIAIADTLIALIQCLVSEKWAGNDTQMAWDEKHLFTIFKQCMTNGEQAVIEDGDYLSMFGFMGKKGTAQELWVHIKDQIGNNLSTESASGLGHILKYGTLSTRILKAINEDFSPENIQRVYKQLGNNLKENSFFMV